MKTLSMTKVLGAGIFLNDRDAAVVQDGYANPRYCSGCNGTQYRTANVERTNGYEKNIYETNRHRNNVNRTVTETHPKGEVVTVHAQASPGAQAHAASKLHKQSSASIKCNGNKEEQHGESAQAHQ